MVEKRNRCIRIFISSTFRDMVAERNELMTHAWPELRRFCRERHVELVEIDLRWGITEEQSKRRETLKVCLDEIHACRPFFIGLLGERYGWSPDEDSFTPDLVEEQPWVVSLRGRSVTELEMVHGVLSKEKMHRRAFFYFRDPAYVNQLPPGQRFDLTAENAEALARLEKLKINIRNAAAEDVCRLRESYSDPRQLVEWVVEDMKAAIEAEFPRDNIPDALAREADKHEAFAETRCRAYVHRPEYFDVLDHHASGEGEPLGVFGDPGSGKSALLANWVKHWRETHPRDFIFQHYVGNSSGSASYWGIIARLIAEIKRWTSDFEELPRDRDELLKTFPLWLAKARSHAARTAVRFIVVLDALNQLDDEDHALSLGWLPDHVFVGPLRLIGAALQNQTGDILKKRGWKLLFLSPMPPGERRQLIEQYLSRFGKKMGARHLDRIIAVAAAGNPLYLRTMLDELRVTGTHSRLDERLDDYLSAPDVPALLKKVLSRYQRDYENDRPGLVSEAFGLIWAARRGLTENELLRLLKPPGLPQLPLSLWSPLRTALEENLTDHGGILNFAHDFLRATVQKEFVPDEGSQTTLRLRLADDFESQPVTSRSCDELPWLLRRANQSRRLRRCLLDIGCFLEIQARDPEELMHNWVWLGEARTIGPAYLASFTQWSQNFPGLAVFAANRLALFLCAAALYSDAEPLIRRVLAAGDEVSSPGLLELAPALSNLGAVLFTLNRFDEAEPLMRRALDLNRQRLGVRHPVTAVCLNNLAQLLKVENRFEDAGSLMLEALAINEDYFGSGHPVLIKGLYNLGMLRQATGRLDEAEVLYRRALQLSENNFGPQHPEVAACLNNLAWLLFQTHRLTEAEPLMRRALFIDQATFGLIHPKVAIRLNNLAEFAQAAGRLEEAEPLLLRALKIDEEAFGNEHPKVALRLNNLAMLRQSQNQTSVAESLYLRALEIDSNCLGPDHPDVARDLNNLAGLLFSLGRLQEAEKFMKQSLEIYLKFSAASGSEHPYLQTAATGRYYIILQKMGLRPETALAKLNELAYPFGFQFGGAS